MTISFVGANSAATTTCTPTTHTIGDLIIFCAGRGANATAPSLGSGYTNMGTGTKIGGTTTAAISTRVGYKIATATNDAGGTWTNATEVECVVYSKSATSTLAIGANTSANNSTTSLSIPALTLTNQNATLASSWVVGFGASNTATQISGTGTGLTNRVSTTTGTGRIAAFDTNGGVATWTGSTVTVATGNWVGWAVEVIEKRQTQQSLATSIGNLFSDFESKTSNLLLTNPIANLLSFIKAANVNTSPIRVQGANAGSGSTTVPNISATGSVVGSGHAIIGIVSDGNHPVFALTSVTDDKGNSYNILDSVDDSNGQVNYSFVLGNITNGPSVLTANFSGANQWFRSIEWEEYSNVAALSNPTDGHTVNLQQAPATTTDAITSTSITTTVNGDLIWGATVNSFNQTSATAGTGYSLRTDEATGAVPIQTEDKILGTAGSATATFTQAASPGSQSTFIVALKPLSSASTTQKAVTAAFNLVVNDYHAVQKVITNFFSLAGIFQGDTLGAWSTTRNGTLTANGPPILSNNNKTATATTGTQQAHSTDFQGSGLHYAELFMNTVTPGALWSLNDITGTPYIYELADGTGGNDQATFTGTGAGFSSGTYIGLAWNATLGKAWVIKTNGLWNNDILANQNPATGTGGINLTANNPTAITWGSGSLNDAATINTGTSPFNYAMPAGFSPWRAQASVGIFRTVQKVLSASLISTLFNPKAISKTVTNLIGNALNFVKAFVSGGGAVTQKAMTIIYNLVINDYHAAQKIFTVPFNQVVSLFNPRTILKTVTNLIGNALKRIIFPSFIYHVQGASGGATGSSATVIATLGIPVRLQGAVVGTVTWGSGVTTDLTSVTDDKGNNYTISERFADTTNSQSAASFVLGNITNAPTTITANLGTARSFTSIVIDEYSGVIAAADPRDGHTGQFQTSATGTDSITSTSITTTVNKDLIWGGVMNSGSASTEAAGTGFTLQETTTASGGSMTTESSLQSVAGSIAATFTPSATGSFLSFVIALKPAGGTALIQKAMTIIYNLVINDYHAAQKIFTVPFNQVVSLFKRISKSPLVVSIGQVVSIFKNIGKSATVISISQLVTLAKSSTFKRVFTVAIGQVASVLRNISKIIIVSINETISLVKNIGKVAFVASIGSTVSKFTVKALSSAPIRVNIGQVVTTFKIMGKVFTVPLGQVFTIFRTMNKTLTNIIGQTVSLFKGVNKSFRNIISLIVNFTPHVGALARTFVITFGQTFSSVKGIQKIIVVPINQLILTVKKISKIAFTATIGNTLTFFRQFATNKTPFVIAIGQTVSILKRISNSRIFTVAFNETMSTYKVVNKIIINQISNLLSVVKTLPKKVTASIGLTVRNVRSLVRNLILSFTTGQQTILIKGVNKYISIMVGISVTVTKTFYQIFTNTIGLIVNATAAFQSKLRVTVFTINIGTNIVTKTLKMIYSLPFARPFNAVQPHLTVLAKQTSEIISRPKEALTKINASAKNGVSSIKARVKSVINFIINTK